MRRHQVRICSFFLLLSSFTLAFTGCGSVSGNSATPTPTPVTNPSPTPIASPTPNPSPTPSPTPVASSQMIYEASIQCSVGNKSCADGNSTDGVYAYRIDPANGEVTDAPGSPFNTGSNTNFVAALPSGNFVYAADTTIEEGDVTTLGTNDIVAFRPDPVTGSLTRIATTSLPFQPVDLVAHPSENFLYVSTGEILGFTANPNTGALTPIALASGLTNGQGAHSMVIDPSGKHLYAAITDRVFGFTINSTTGVLTPMAGSPFTFPNFPFLGDLSIHPSGKFLYVTASFLGTPEFATFGMAIDVTTGALTELPGSPFPTNGFFSDFAFVKDGSTAWASDHGKSLGVFSVNISTGELTLENTFPTAEPTDEPILTDQTGQFVYVGEAGIMGFRIQGDGSPEALPNFPHGGGLASGQHSLAIAPLP